MDGETDGFPSDGPRRVIEHDRGAAVVLATAGTGNTRVMTARLARAVARGLDPARALGVTFTNRAAAVNEYGFRKGESPFVGRAAGGGR